MSPPREQPAAVHTAGTGVSEHGISVLWDLALCRAVSGTGLSSGIGSAMTVVCIAAGMDVKTPSGFHPICGSVKLTQSKQTPVFPSPGGRGGCQRLLSAECAQVWKSDSRLHCSSSASQAQQSMVTCIVHGSETQSPSLSSPCPRVAAGTPASPPASGSCFSHWCKSEVPA